MRNLLVYVFVTALLYVCMIIGAAYTFLSGPNWEKDKSDIQALTLTLYYEGAVNESKDGLIAIASVVKNRARSEDFPDSLFGVVVQGSKGKTNGGCQFSFTCDGISESVQSLCELRPKEMKKYWGKYFPCERRWVKYFVAAVIYNIVDYDNTDGATLYYTGSRPYWAVDCVEGSEKKLGSHTFCRSKYLGKDIRPEPKESRILYWLAE